VGGAGKAETVLVTAIFGGFMAESIFLPPLVALPPKRLWERSAELSQTDPKFLSARVFFNVDLFFAGKT
jgi:hypothetical protein